MSRHKWNWSVGDRVDSGWFRINLSTMGQTRVAVPVMTERLYIVLLFELDRRWARMKRATYSRCARKGWECPYGMDHNCCLPRPPFYSMIEAEWGPTNYRAWVRWTKKNRHKSTRQVIEQLVVVLGKMQHSISEGDIERLYKGITGGVVTSRQGRV